MIQKKDLKIGNWVQNDAGYKWQIEDGWQLDEATDKEMYQPIPLTPEILLKCGFTKDSLGFTYKDSNAFSVYYNHNLSNGRYAAYWMSFAAGNDFKFLHQLQNLYHSLTGQELNYNHI